jgi:hypothetical protein
MGFVELQAKGGKGGIDEAVEGCGPLADAGGPLILCTTRIPGERLAFAPHDPA